MPTGKSSNLGAPGPTWLALAGTAFARTAASTRQPPSVLWQYHRGREDRRWGAMVWPTWEPSLDVDAVAVLLTHPCLQLDVGSEADAERAELGITAIWRSDRLALSQSDGPLMQPTRAWPRP